MDGFKIVNFTDEVTMQAELNKGRFAGIVKIEKSEVNAKQPFRLILKTTSSSNDQWPQVKSMLDDMLNKISDKMYADRNKYTSFEFNNCSNNTSKVRSLHAYFKYISLLSSILSNISIIDINFKTLVYNNSIFKIDRISY